MSLPEQGNLAVCPQDAEGEGASAAVADSAGTRAAEGAGQRPFVERRRNRPVQDSWPDALDAVQRHLIGLEKAERCLQELERTCGSIFETAPIGMFQMTREGRFITLNRAMAKILGHESLEAIRDELARGRIVSPFRPSDWMKSGGARGEDDARLGVEIQVRCRDGRQKWLRLNVSPVREAGRVVRYEGTAEDITDRKRAEIRTEFLAYHDPLTRLPNRMLFNERFAEVLAAAAKTGQMAALLLVEFDRFKVINDSLGEVFGDQLLREIARRLREVAGPSSVVARIGGAEFAIVFAGADEACDATGMARRMLEKLGVEYTLLGQCLDLSCSIGVSLFPANGRDCKTLLQRADVAMARAREEGTNRFMFFMERMDRELKENLELENGLRRALAKDEFFLEYQPQVDIRTGKIIGLEALLRWNHRKLGVIPPGKFIGLAESSGLIVPIGEWVLRRACFQACDWLAKGLPRIPIAVNVSAIQFRQQSFCDSVRKALRDTGLEPGLLELELTENLLLTNADVLSSTVTELHEIGVRLAIDDFGTGYSSLGYLKHFKVNRLKIDRTFVRDLPTDTGDAAIAGAIIELARALNVAVLAEGVESEAQLSFLHKLQCYAIQGFYFSRPTGAATIDSQLRTGFSHRLPAVVA